MNATVNNSPSFDINAYRITQTYGEALGSKKLITVVAVGKPPKGRFFGTSRDEGNTLDVFVLEDKVEGTYHLVSPGVADALGGPRSSYNPSPCSRPCKQPVLNPRPFSV